MGLKRYTEGRRKISTSLEISVELVLAKFQAENATYEVTYFATMFWRCIIISVAWSIFATSIQSKIDY